jgi:predicted nucleotide-binding protein
MSRINADLLERLKAKSGLGQSRVYALIDKKVRTAHLPRNLAAIAVAAEYGVNISKFASTEDLAALRGAGRGTAEAAPLPTPTIESRPSAKKRNSRGKSGANAARRGTTVFVVHGRDSSARDSVFAFLRSLGLRPLEWTQALRLTKKGTPYVGEVLDAAFREAAAIVVLLTPDDEARLKPTFLISSDPVYERNLTGQARPNVLFEAGMAFGKDPNSTVLVQIGSVRPFSDVGGRHVLQLNDSSGSRIEFVTKLSNAGCTVDNSGVDWLTAGSFGSPATGRRTRVPRAKK